MLRGRLQMVPAPQRTCRWGQPFPWQKLSFPGSALLCSGGGKPNVSGQRTSQGRRDNEIDVLLSYFIKGTCEVLNTWDGK